MEVTEIVKELGEAELLPEDALNAAIAQKEETIPVFLRIVEEFGNGKSISDGVRSPLLLVVHLLAEFEEQKAFPPLIKFLRSDPERVEAALGDAITETLSRVIISIYDGNLALLKEMILERQVDQFVRFAGLQAMAYLTKVGQIELQITELFLAECNKKLARGKEDFAWVGWQSAIALLGLKAFAPAVKEAFEVGRISPTHMSFASFESALRYTLENPEDMALFEKERLRPFKDTIQTFSYWHGFSKEYWDQIHGEESISPGIDAPTGTKTNPFLHVGRNDPCPCGSGKKYKRCCLH